MSDEFKNRTTNLKIANYTLKILKPLVNSIKTSRDRFEKEHFQFSAKLLTCIMFLQNLWYYILVFFT